MKKIIINADDFGLTEKISDVIIAIFKKGNLSSTSLLANTPSTRYAIELAKKNKKLAVGLHFNITEGQSIVGASSLTNSEGYFLDKLKINSRVYLNSINLEDLEQELSAQYQIIINQGLSLTHIDSHQHMHMNPKIFRIVADFAKKKGINIRIAFPHFIRRANGKINLKKRIKQLILYYASIVNSKYADQISLKYNTSFNSIFDFHPFKFPTEIDYINLIDLAKSNIHELMIHVYEYSDQLKEFYDDTYIDKIQFFKKANYENKILNNKPIFNSYELITFKDI